jgi:hypothetical protein
MSDVVFGGDLSLDQVTRKYMVDWIIILGIHICREEASFQRHVHVASAFSLARYYRILFA